jgi:hypothetical protein
VARLQDEEAERRAFIAVPYDAEIHKLNPFLGDNQTAQAEFIRRDPELAKFYKAEAEPATIAVFGHHRNYNRRAIVQRPGSRKRSQGCEGNQQAMARPRSCDGNGTAESSRRTNCSPPISNRMNHEKLKLTGVMTYAGNWTKSKTASGSSTPAGEGKSSDHRW